MRVKVFESDPNIPDKYYALISNGIVYFAAMPDHFDWAVDMLAEDDNADAYIGLIEHGTCIKTFRRDDVGLELE